MIEALKKLRQYLLTGVSYAIPFIAAGGILLAISLAAAPTTDKGKDASQLTGIMKLVFEIGSASFKLMLPVLAGYIAYGVAGRPGLVPGFVGGYLSDKVNAGFLGALLVGLLAGWLVELIKKIPTHKYIKPIMPILIIPMASSLVVGVVMLTILGIPIAHLMAALDVWLKSMGQGSVLLAMLLGAMIAFDMGGPVNKAAFFFGAAMIKEGNCGIMGACAAAICTPPLGLGLATLLKKQLWTQEEREAGGAALAMGMIGITEGAIPFAAADPLRVIPCIMGGSMVASTIAMWLKVADHAPHGGPVVLGVVDNKIAYVLAIIAGSVVTALAINTIKIVTTRKRVEAEAPAGVAT